MRKIEWIDDDGYKRRRIVRDNENNMDYGIYLEPPPVDLIDWEAIRRDLHNQFVNRNLLSADDIGGKNTNSLKGAIMSAVKPHVIKYFREAVNND